RIAPRIAHRFGERAETPAELLEPGGEHTRGPAFANVRIPAADIHEAQAVVAAHEARNTFRLRLERTRRDRVAAGRDHLLPELAHHAISRGKAFVDLRTEARALVHLGDQGALPRIDRRAADGVERNVRHLRFAAKGNRQPAGERDRAARTELGCQAVHETGRIAAASQRLAELDRILGLEMAPAGVFGTREWDERELAPQIE